ncbi:MAG: hypothetical protein QNJ97_28660 [Myxococcota bacterium]|nr:hypothetical protein [Myxococcota bacterium]
MYAQPIDRTATSADRERLGLPTGNGTVVTLAPLEEITIPNFERLAHDLERHIELRYRPDSQPNISLVLREIRSSGSGREQELVGFQPVGEVVLERMLGLPEFSAYGGTATLALYKSKTPLVLVGPRGGMARLWRSEAGIVVGDGRTAHDISFLHARGADDDAAQHIYGELHLPQIPSLLKEYELFETQREKDASIPAIELNPAQVTDPDRLGLNRDHPFVKAVEECVRPLIEEVLETLQRDLTPSAQDRVSAELRDALEKLGEKLAEKLEDTETNTGDEPDDNPWGLSVIPQGIRVELERTKRIGVYYRVESWDEENDPQCTVSTTSDAVLLSTGQVTLKSIEERPGHFRGSFDVTGSRLADLVAISVQLKEEIVTVRASVREPPAPNVTLDKDLQFSRRRYVSVPEKRKRIEVFADASLTDRAVEITAERDLVAISNKSLVLSYDEIRGIAVAHFFTESASEATDVLRVECGELADEASIIYRPIGGRARITFWWDEVENFGPGRRFKWDRDNPNLLHIAAKHKSLARVLGPEGEWPGQNLPQTRAILAELISEAYVDRQLQGVLPSLGVGPENAVDPVEYESYRYRFFEECFTLCHKALTPAFEAG